MGLFSNKYFTTISIALIGLNFLNAQNSDADSFVNFQNKYSDYPLITVNNKKTIYINVNAKGDFDIETKAIKENLILTEAGAKYNTHNIFSNFFHRNVKINAFTQISNEKKISKIKAQVSEPISDGGSNIFHDDGRRTEVLFLGLQKGAISIVENTQKITDPRFLTKFYFGGQLPSYNNEFELIAPNSVEIIYNLYGLDTDKITYQKTEKGKNVSHKWVLKESNVYNLQKSTIPANYILPHITVRIGKINKNNQESDEILTDVSSLYNMYRNFIQDVNTSSNPELKSFVDSITAGLTDELEIVKTIYTWVQNNIKYIAFEAGMDGFIPSQGFDVYKKRYGDCKGMSSVLNAMLQEKGIKSYLTWVGTDDLPYTYTQEPSPVVDNHMVLTYKTKDGKNIILDATNNLKPFGVTPSSLQGKQVLIGINEKNYEVVTLEEINAEENTLIDEIEIELENSTLKGTGKYHAKGYFSEEYGYYLSALNQLDQKDFVKELTLKGNNKYSLNDFELLQPIEQNHEIKLAYKFTLDDYIKVLNGEIIINPHMERALKNALIEPEQVLYHYNSFKYAKKNTTTLKIPDGFTINKFPENFSIKRDEYEFTIDYTLNNNQLIIRENVTIHYRFLPESLFEQWNSDVKKTIKAYNNSIKLIQKSK